MDEDATLNAPEAPASPSPPPDSPVYGGLGTAVESTPSPARAATPAQPADGPPPIRPVSAPPPPAAPPTDWQSAAWGPQFIYAAPPAYGAPPRPVPLRYAPPPPGYYPVAYRPAPKTPGLAVAGFVCSMAGLFFGVFYLILPILGIVFSAVGRSQAKKTDAPMGLAVAGLWIGIGSLVLYVAVIVVFLTTFSST